MLIYFAPVAPTLVTSRLTGVHDRQPSASDFRVTPLDPEQPYKPGPLAALLSNDNRPAPPPPPRDEHVRTASEQWREQRKHGGDGDYSRQLENKELNRLRKYVDTSYNPSRTSLGSSDVTLSDDRGDPPPPPPLAQRAGVRRSLDFEQRQPEVTTISSSSTFAAPHPTVFNQSESQGPRDSFASREHRSSFSRFDPHSNNQSQLVSNASSAPVNQSAFASLRQNDVIDDIAGDVRNMRERIDTLRQMMESELAEARDSEQDVTHKPDDADDHSIRMRNASIRMFDDVTDRTPQRHSYAGHVRDRSDVIEQLPPRYSLAQPDVTDGSSRDFHLPSNVATGRYEVHDPYDDVTRLKQSYERAASQHAPPLPISAPPHQSPPMTSSSQHFDGYDRDLPVLPSNDSPFKQVRATGARDDSVLFESSRNWQPESELNAMRPKSYAGGLIGAPLTRLEKLQMETSISKSMGTLNVRDLEESAKILIGQELDQSPPPLHSYNKDMKGLCMVHGYTHTRVLYIYCIIFLYSRIKFTHQKLPRTLP